MSNLINLAPLIILVDFARLNLSGHNVNGILGDKNKFLADLI